MKPSHRPARPLFSSGPCAKRPGWSLESLSDALLGRSHRSKPGKAKLSALIDRTRKILNIPDDYRIGIVPASDTGAVEMALWSLLGARGVDVLVWESFSQDWATDVVKQLKLADARILEADYGQIPDLRQVNWQNDVVFVWNGTTSGARVPNGDWIADDRAGLSICDATSAAFAMDLPWQKLDVVTWSWQKVLGGEGQHGMIVLSPRAVERLESYKPAWPLPKIFRLTSGGKISEGIFKGETINTPSMLCVEDQLDALDWAASVGGLPALMKRSEQNLAAIADWVAKTPWVDFLVADPAIRSCTSICIKIADADVLAKGDDVVTKVAARMAALLDSEGVAYDVAAYRSAPPGLRIWGGATIETSDITALLPWLDWAFATAKQELAVAA